MNFEEVVKKRASVRKYSDKLPDIKNLIKCIEIANLAPSPGNIALIKYIIIEDQEKIDEIAEACQQDFIRGSQILIVVCSEQKNAETAYESRGKKYTKQHAGAVIEHLLLEITNLGMASCWVGAYSDMILKRILEIPEDIDIEAILPIGYQSRLDKTMQRKKPVLENRIFFGTWKNKYRKPYTKISD
ncbi:Coenzyme F420:L-glutamate ligase [uncultured archaeon]|nr:Coenzyme F420:L-glutamate ligase [uncultured archaeon]